VPLQFSIACYGKKINWDIWKAKKNLSVLDNQYIFYSLGFFTKYCKTHINRMMFVVKLMQIVTTGLDYAKLISFGLVSNKIYINAKLTNEEIVIARINNFLSLFFCIIIQISAIY